MDLLSMDLEDKECLLSHITDQVGVAAETKLATELKVSAYRAVSFKRSRK